MRQPACRSPIACALFIVAILATTPRALAQDAGPDTWGYVANSVPMAWEDISMTGSFRGRSNGVNSMNSVGLGFAFPYYQGLHSSVHLSICGQIGLTSSFGGSGCSNSNGNLLPFTSAGSGARLLPLWGSWDGTTAEPFGQPGRPGVYVESRGFAPNRRCIIQWHRLRWNTGGFNLTSSEVTFQVILYERGDFHFQYLDTITGDQSFDNGARATVGWHDSGGGPLGRIVQWSYLEPVIHSGSAIAITLAPDVDGDGVPNQVDNCMRSYNPDQADPDGDGIGAACDTNYCVATLPPTQIDLPAVLQAAGGVPLPILQGNLSNSLSLAGKHVTLYGHPFARLIVSSSGVLSGQVSVDQTELLTELTSGGFVAGFWDHLMPCRAPGGIGLHAHLFDDRLVVTWLNVPEYASGSTSCVNTLGVVTGSNTFQVTFEFHTGRILINYDGMTAVDGIVGVVLSGFLLHNSAESNLSASAGGSGTVAGTYEGLAEHFTGTAGDNFDLQNVTLVFSPDSCGSAPVPDADSDGVPDSTDNCVSVANADQADIDTDGQGDVCDADDDNDGVPDDGDSDALNRFVCGDADGDGCDDCTSGTDNALADGLDTDLDGVCNEGDVDDDSDGVADAVDSDPLNRFACRDSDGDGCDDCNSGTENVAADGPDNDGDGQCDVADSDDDNDGVPDATDSDPINRFACGDSDGDACEDCITGTFNAAADGTDFDGDGLCNSGDPDDDNDSLPDVSEATRGTNPLDADSDDDGLLDGTEVDAAGAGTCPSPLTADSDGDSLPDGAEVSGGTNPCNIDTDGDTISDDVDPSPTVPGVSSSFLEALTRDLATDVIPAIDLAVIPGPNNNARRARRNVMASHAANAANAIATGDYAAAIDELTAILVRIDGDSSPPDWLANGPEKTSLRIEVESLLLLLDLID